jgi:hypothetical protein
MIRNAMSIWCEAAMRNIELTIVRVLPTGSNHGARSHGRRGRYSPRISEDKVA